MTEPNESSRRDFLRGRVSVTALPPSSSEPSPASWEDATRAGYLEQYTKRAMACQFQILLNMRQHRNGAQAVADAFELIDHLEDQLTVYREHSDVSGLNREATSRVIPTETRLFRLLSLAKQIHPDTNGAFDITSSPLTKLWGFDERAGSVPQADAIERVLPTVGSEYLNLDNKRETVSFAHPDLQINLGGIGKGHALDRAAELFRQNDVPDFIIHGGQSSVLARGRQDRFEDQATSVEDDPESEQNGGWIVGLSHPTVPNVRLAEFTLRNHALGTSGTGRQGFFQQGKRYGHIIDPRTGWPTDHVLSSTVISPSAAISDALATAFFVMTIEEVEAYCRSHQEVAALLVVPSKKKGQVALEWFNLGEDQWKRL